MEPADTMAIISAIIAIIAAAVSYLQLVEQKRVAALTVGYDSSQHAEALLLDHPGLLELHGITEKEIEDCDAKPEEIAYLVTKFTAAQSFHRIMGDEYENLNSGQNGDLLNDYRKNLLRNHKVQKIWKHILRDRMMQVSPFTKAVDEFIKDCETVDQ